MARDHARIQTAIWNDPDWRKLDQGAQHLYWMLASSPDLSYCGRLDYIPITVNIICSNNEFEYVIFGTVNWHDLGRCGTEKNIRIAAFYYGCFVLF